MKNKIILGAVLGFLALAETGLAAAKKEASEALAAPKVVLSKEDIKKIHAPPQALNVPDFNTSYQAVTESTKTPEIAATETKRGPASAGARVCNEDLMSLQLKTFRNRLININNGYALEKLINDYYPKAIFDTLPNDLKFEVIKLSTLLPF